MERVKLKRCGLHRWETLSKEDKSTLDTLLCRRGKDFTYVYKDIETGCLNVDMDEDTIYLDIDYMNGKLEDLVTQLFGRFKSKMFVVVPEEYEARIRGLSSLVIDEERCYFRVPKTPKIYLGVCREINNNTLYSSIASLRTMMNKETNKLVGMNSSAIQRLFKTREDVNTNHPNQVTLEEVIDVKQEDVGVDDIYLDILKDYRVCIRKNDLVGKVYPFMLIKFKDVYLKYDIYRYVAGLPFYVALPDGNRLPTVDHINRNNKDNRLINLRYCSVTQNQWNSCRQSKTIGYHGVTEGRFEMKVVPLTLEEERSRDILRLWMTLLDDTYDVLKTTKRKIDSDQYIDKGSCRYSLLDGINTKVLLEFVYDIQTYIIPTFMKGEYKEGDDKTVTKEYVTRMTPCNAEMCHQIYQSIEVE